MQASPGCEPPGCLGGGGGAKCGGTQVGPAPGGESNDRRDPARGGGVDRSQWEEWSREVTGQRHPIHLKGPSLAPGYLSWLNEEALLLGQRVGLKRLGSAQAQH